MALATSLPDTLRQRLIRASDLLPGRAAPQDDWERCLPTSIEALDRLLRGGLRRGELIEIVGRGSSGRFSLVLAALSSATRAGESTALVDLGDHFEAQQAAALGLDLDRLLWLRPRRLKDALAATEILIHGGFPLVVLDLGQPPIPGGRGAAASWLRLLKETRKQGTALLVSSPYRCSGTAANAVVTTRGLEVLWRGRGSAPRLLGTLRSTLELRKARGRAPGDTEELRLRYESGALAAHPSIVLPLLPVDRGSDSRRSITPADRVAATG